VKSTDADVALHLIGKGEDMDKMLVVVFPGEKSAYEARNALSALDQEGSIALYAAAVMAKDAAGKVSVKQEADRGPVGTTVGLLTGTLVGLVGGPAGAAIGAAAGAYGGGMFDLVRVGIGTDFVDEVASSLKPGKVAVIAEIDEDWVTPVDSRMDALGGEVFRRARTAVVDDQLSAEQDALNEEITDLKAEASRAHGEAKAKVQKRLDAASARFAGLQSRARTSFENEKQHVDAKLRTLQDRTDRATGEAKAGFQRRIEKLRRAWEHTKEQREPSPSREG
jgi:uncharacterized membrane protein